MPGRVYIHVGLPKTGTTYLQQSLWLSRERLAEDGVLVPGDNHRFQRLAFWDLLGRRLRGVDQARVPGKWRALVATTRQWRGRQVLLSDEFLVNARPTHVRRIVRAFEPAEVHVVVTVRDLTRVLGSMWQQDLSSGRTWPWPEFLAAVRDPAHGPATAGIGFWLRQDLRKLLATWESAVPRERIHIVVVPGAGAPRTRLLELFAAATELDPARLTPSDRPANPSVGIAESELLRRLNEGLAGRLNERQYQRVLNGVVKPVLLDRNTAHRIRLPESERAWVSERTEAMVALLCDGGYQVVGDLADLRPADAGPTEDPEQASDADVAEAAVAALTAAAERYAALWWDGRGSGARKHAGRRERVASAGRALGFRARVRALEQADRNRLLAGAARLYLRYAARGGRTGRH